MARPKLALSSWGDIAPAAPYHRSKPGARPVRLVTIGRSHYLPDVYCMVHDEFAPGAKSTRPTTWRARGTYRSKDGKYHAHEGWGPTAADAKRALLAKGQEIASGAHAKGSVADAMTRYLDMRIAEGAWAAATRAAYRRAADEYLGPLIGTVGLHELTGGAVDDAMRAIPTGVVPAAWTVLNGTLAWCKGRGDVTEHVMVGLKRPKHISTPTPGIDPETARALRAYLVAYVTTPRPLRGGPKKPQYLPDLNDLLLATGCRPSEVLGLRWQDVDLEEGSVTICGTVIGGSKVKLQRQPWPKNKKPVRLLLPSWCVATLLRMRTEATHELLFHNRNGGLLWPNNTGRAWRRALAGSAFEGIQRRSPRKGVGTVLAHTVGPEAAQGQLRHARLSTTEEHYIETPPVAPDMRATLDVFGPAAG